VSTAPDPARGELTESQRHTEAVVLLQEHPELGDDDTIALLHEFEVNVRAVDTFLALHKQGLRSKWLANKVARLRSYATAQREGGMHEASGS
jgi:hypothetical protein